MTSAGGLVGTIENAVHPWCLFRAPIWCPAGEGGTREAGGHVAVSLVGRRSTRNRTVARSIGGVSTRFGEGGGQLDSRRARGECYTLVRENQRRLQGSFRRESKSMTTNTVS